MKAYKGFNKDMKCRGFQFEEGKSYEEKEASLCKKGFHACENPIDVFSYYEPGNSVYRKVELSDVCENRENDSKVCAKKIKIGAEVSLRDMIRAGVKIDIQSAKKTTSNNSSPAATSGDRSHAATSGDHSHAATSGDSSHAATSGDYSPAATSGKDSIAAAIGRNSKAKSSIGNWIVLAEYGEWKGNTYPVPCVKCAKIDGEILKPDTWYKLQNGEFVEA